MIVTAHQPLYLPWLGTIHKALVSDKFCILDNVQFADRDFTHRNRITSVSGQPKWLTIPVHKKEHRLKLIKDVQIKGRDWINKHLELIECAYHKHPYFTDYFPDLSSTLMQVKSNFLIDYTMPLLSFLFETFECQTEIVFSSELGIASKKSELILDIAKELSATKYLSGAYGRGYLDVASFENVNIAVIFQDFKTTPYPQRSTSFQSGLSCIDLLFNHGPLSREVLIRENPIS